MNLYDRGDLLHVVKTLLYIYIYIRDRLGKKMSLIENIRDNNWKPQHKPSQEDWIFKLRITSLFYFKIYNIFIEFSTNFFFFLLY